MVNKSLLDSSKNKRQRAYKRGWWAEIISCIYLVCKAHRILSRRYKTPYGEIDIITKRGRHIYFIEVKARPTIEEGLYSISTKQQQRIRDAAEYFRAQHPAYQQCDCHIDVIILAKRRWPHYIRDAF